MVQWESLAGELENKLKGFHGLSLVDNYQHLSKW
jgi:hypothetical protein